MAAKSKSKVKEEEVQRPKAERAREGVKPRAAPAGTGGDDSGDTLGASAKAFAGKTAAVKPRVALFRGARRPWGRSRRRASARARPERIA